MAEETPPKQTVLGGDAGERELGRKMEAMSAEADVIVAGAKGKGAAGYGAGVIAIHFAMRPEFGPANAALPREKKIHELAVAAGIQGAPPDIAGPQIDAFVREVRSLAAALRAKGLAVEEQPVSSGAILWSPPRWGWRLVVSDPSRLVEESIPYGAPSGNKVAPRLTLFFFEHVRMAATQNMARREQPGTPEAAGPAWVAFTLQFPQSHDQDPRGTLRDAALALLAPGGPERGILRSSFDGDAPPERAPAAVPGTHVVLWSAMQGMENEMVLVPHPR